MRTDIYIVTVTEFYSVISTSIYRTESEAIAKYLELCKLAFPEVEPRTVESYMNYMVSEQAIEDGIEGLVQFEKVALK